MSAPGIAGRGSFVSLRWHKRHGNREWFGLSCLNFEKSVPGVCEKPSIGATTNASIIKQRAKNLQDGPVICFNKLHFVGFGIALT